MLVKFNKKQIKALASLSSRANAIFDELQKKNPSLYSEDERRHTCKMFMLGIIDSIVELGEISVED